MPNNDYILRSDAKKAITDQWWTEIDRVPAADVEQKRRWIPVTERLPENYQSVIVHRDDGGIFIWEYFGESPTEECWIDDHSNVYSTYTVTHWMLLPEPPKGEDDGESTK